MSGRRYVVKKTTYRFGIPLGESKEFFTNLQNELSHLV